MITNLKKRSFHNINWDENGPQNVLQTGADWKGLKLVGDNVYKNIRPSLQRFDNKTNSLIQALTLTLLWHGFNDAIQEGSRS